MGGDRLGQDSWHSNAKPVKDLPLCERGEQGVTVELFLMDSHESGGLHVFALLASSPAFACKGELLLDFGAVGGVDGCSIIPDLLIGWRMRQGAIKSQSAAILDGVNQQLRALIKLAQLGVPLSWRQLGRLAQLELQLSRLLCWFDLGMLGDFYPAKISSSS